MGRKLDYMTSFRPIDLGVMWGTRGSVTFPVGGIPEAAVPGDLADALVGVLRIAEVSSALLEPAGQKMTPEGQPALGEELVQVTGRDADPLGDVLGCELVVGEPELDLVDRARRQ
jgi:hypothetical protein